MIPFQLPFIYLLSRYEGFQPKSYKRSSTVDSHASQSQQKKLRYFVPTQYADELSERVCGQNLGLSYDSELSKFDCVPSFDIDVAWAYKGRPLWRTLGGFLKGNIGQSESKCS